MNTIKLIKLQEAQNYTLKEIIAKAGFSIVLGNYCITLVDKVNAKADNYADLTFGTLIDACKAVQPYVRDQFMLV